MSRVILRPYQDDCIASVFRAFETYQSALAVLPTGAGKTTVFVTIGHRWPKPQRVLVVAHREELIQQAAERISLLTGDEAGIEMADAKVSAHDGCKWVVASVQSLSRESRLSRFDPSQFGLVVVDEAHHSVASTYLKVVNHFAQNPACKLLGVTATPNRADELAMGQIFRTCAYQLCIEDAVEGGWLVPVRQQVVKVDGLDFSKVRTTAGDFNEGDLEAVLAQEKVLHGIAAPTVDLAGDLPTLVFCVTVAHAERMSEIIDRYKKGASNWLCGATPKEQRRQILADFKSGKTQFLCNVGVLLEGFDAPNCAAIAMARPTKSLALYTQVIGRSLRALPGVIDGMETATGSERRAAIAASAKPSALLLDYAGNAGRHKIVTAADVLGGKWGEPVRAYSRKNAEEEGDAVDLEESLQRASDEMAWEEEYKRRLLATQEARRRAAIKAQAEYSTEDVDIYGGYSPVSAQTVAAGPSEKQIKYLVYLGVPRATAAGYTKKQASVVIDKLVAKKEGRAG